MCSSDLTGLFSRIQILPDTNADSYSNSNPGTDAQTVWDAVICEWH